MTQKSAAQPSLLDFRKLVTDLFDHRAVIYWADMLTAALLGWAGLVAAIWRQDFDLITLGLILVSAIAFLRALLFIHEISHFRRGVLPGFTAVWNLLIGVPLLVPSFMYVGTHTDHHKRTLYGTIKDPEYLPLVHMGRWRILRFLLEMPLVPLLLVLRYGLLSPISWCIPPLRKVVIERMSSLVINPEYLRKRPEGPEARRFFILEFCVFLWVAAVVAVIATGRLPWTAVIIWYAVSATVALINQVRTLAAHVYANEGDEVTTMEQLLDSCNVRGLPIITELVFPVGLRYHALHHLLADMPYHNLGRAHRRFLDELPEDSPYLKTDYSGLWTLTCRLWKSAAGHQGWPSAWRKERS